MTERTATWTDPGKEANLDDLLTAFDSSTRPDQLTRLLRIVNRQRTEGMLTGLTSLRVAILGNGNLTVAAHGLQLELLRYRIDATLWEAPFDQWATALIDSASTLAAFDPQVVLLWLSSLGLTQGATHLDLEILPLIEQSITAFTVRSAAPIIIVLPEELEEETVPFSEEGCWRRQFSAELERRCKDQVLFVDPAAAIAGVEVPQRFSSRFWYTAKMPAHPSVLITVGRYLARPVASCLPSLIKVIACDLDNTLWGGVVGEDGWANIKLDPFAEGGPFLRLQACLKKLKQKGFLLAAVSKNNECDVRELFEKRTEMLLRWDDFVAIRCSWQPKSTVLIELASTLNLGIQNFCFLDDSSFERNEVRNALPEVFVPELPAQPDGFVSAVLGTRLFDTGRVTDEDRQRTNLYQNETQRNEARQKNASLDDFLASLDLVAEAQPLGPGNLERAAQLLARTNQFNVTTLRHDANHLRRLAADPAVYACIFRVSDRFGDNGLCGVLIARPQDDAYIIDNWVLSCRVMGRTVEHAMFFHLLNWLKARGITRLFGIYRPTTKNTPVSRLYSDLGFSGIDAIASDDGTTHHHLTIDDICPGNRHVRLINANPQ